ncbi:hypothetical protein M9458_050664, partial [Cirrhinus mrigala]
NAIAQTLQGIKGVKNLSDDIIVYGVSQKTHDDALRAVFQRLKDSGLTLNREKCEFNKHRLEFYGFIFSASGIFADPKKVEAILLASEPKDPGEIRSLLGMANYCARFIQDFSTISAPLHDLTKKGTSWQWGNTHKQALQQLKDALASATTTSYFDPTKDTELVANNPVIHVEPLHMSELPEAPWHNLSADFYGPLPSGEYLLVVIDDYMRYPVVKILHSTSTTAVIPVLDDVFSMFVLKTDNGPPFNSSLFTQFADCFGLRHRKITPFWPQANAMAERFMRTLGKAIRTAHTQGIPWKQQSTPHCTTGTSPAELIFKRKVRTKIPIANSSTTNVDDDIRAKDKRAKDKMKALSDTRRHAVHINIKPGDTVLCRQQKRNKLTTPYNAKPLTVTKVKGKMVTAEGHGHSITRNCSFFKRLNQETPDLLFELGFENETEEPDSCTVPQRYPARHNRRPPAYLSDYV